VFYAAQGIRPTMEDRMDYLKENDKINVKLFGIFDGHGGQVIICSNIQLLLHHYDFYSKQQSMRSVTALSQYLKVHLHHLVL
jgi:serine/threonine protein phosphatase PrpC